MSEWQKTTLGELCEESGGDIQTGPFGSQLHAADYVPVGVPSIMPQNIGDNRISTDGIARINSDDAKRLSRYLVKEGDIVYSRRGDVERRALIRKEQNGWLCGTGCLRVRFGSKKPIDPTFMSHYLGDPIIRAWIVQHAVGATMPNLNTSILSNVPVLLPSYNEQKAIATILGALDDKIELNRRMNATLEAMARALFKSWFVDFDPVRAKMAGAQPFGMDSETAALFPSRLVSSELGDIPEGWEVVRLGELADVNWGDTNTTKASYIEKGYPAYSASGQDGFLDHADYDHDGIVLSAIGANCGQTWLAKGKWSCIKNTIRLWSKSPNVSNEYLFIATNDIHFWPKRGSAQPFISQTDARNCRIIEPANKLGMLFGKETKELYDRVAQGNQETLRLAKTRDYLLPKLISGDIRIPDAEKFVEGL